MTTPIDIIGKRTREPGSSHELEPPQKTRRIETTALEALDLAGYDPQFESYGVMEMKKALALPGSKTTTYKTEENYKQILTHCGLKSERIDELWNLAKDLKTHLTGINCIINTISSIGNQEDLTLLNQQYNLLTEETDENDPYFIKYTYDSCLNFAVSSKNHDTAAYIISLGGPWLNHPALEIAIETNQPKMVRLFSERCNFDSNNVIQKINLTMQRYSEDKELFKELVSAIIVSSLLNKGIEEGDAEEISEKFFNNQEKFSELCPGLNYTYSSIILAAFGKSSSSTSEYFNEENWGFFPIRRAGGDFSTLHFAIHFENTAILDIFKANEYDINEKFFTSHAPNPYAVGREDLAGHNAFSLAVSWQKPEVIRWMQENDGNKDTVREIFSEKGSPDPFLPKNAYN